MECFNCGSAEITEFFEEVFPCAHCDESNVVVYNFCRSCAATFKTVNDTIISGATFTNEDIMKMTGLTAEDIEQYMEPAGKFMKGLTSRPDERTMSEVVHKCLRCEHVAFETGPGSYCCPACDFVWETL